MNLDIKLLATNLGVTLTIVTFFLKSVKKNVEKDILDQCAEKFVNRDTLELRINERCKQCLSSDGLTARLAEYTTHEQNEKHLISINIKFEDAIRVTNRLLDDLKENLKIHRMESNDRYSEFAKDIKESIKMQSESFNVIYKDISKKIEKMMYEK